MSDERETIAIPLVEERIEVGTRTIETGRIRVSTQVEERRELVSTELSHSGVEVTHVPLNLEVSTPPPVREEGDTTIVPVLEERLVIEKKLFVVEEIRLRRTSGTERHDVPVTVRSERASVERLEGSGETTLEE